MLQATQRVIFLQSSRWQRMSEVLVFVDESGDSCPSQALFSVGAVWCSPKSASKHNTLAPTHQTLMDKAFELTGQHRKELSHSEGLAPHDDALFDEFLESIKVDRSIHHNEKPWSGFPLKFTVASACPRLEVRMAKNPDYGNQTRARCLIEALSPLNHYSGNDGIQAEVVLDEIVWRRALSYCGDEFAGPQCPENLSFHFTYEKSHRMPGLQLADLVAGVNRHFLLTSESACAHRILEQHRLYHIGH